MSGEGERGRVLKFAGLWIEAEGEGRGSVGIRKFYQEWKIEVHLMGSVRPQI